MQRIKLTEADTQKAAIKPGVAGWLFFLVCVKLYKKLQSLHLKRL